MELCGGFFSMSRQAEDTCFVTCMSSSSPVTRRSRPRRSRLPGSSVTSATASTFTTPKTVPRRRRPPTPPRTPPTTAARPRSGPTATSARSSATGLTAAMTTRPSEGGSAPSAFLCSHNQLNVFAHGSELERKTRCFSERHAHM